jgi:GT2 family glycosyltransferase
MKLLTWKGRFDPTFFMTENTIPHSAARNFIASEFLKSDCEVLVSIDSDILPPDDLIERVIKGMSKGHKIVAGYALVFKGNNPNNNSLVMNFANFDGLIPDKPEQDALYEVANVGTGCIAVHRDVFEKMSKPYFEFYFMDPDCTRVKGEDIYFCEKARENGFKIMLDPSLKCRHVKSLII